MKRTLLICLVFISKFCLSQDVLDVGYNCKLVVYSSSTDTLKCYVPEFNCSYNYYEIDSSLDRVYIVSTGVDSILSYVVGFKNGLKHGVEKIYSVSNNFSTIFSYSSYDKGKLHGVHCEYNQNGHLLFVGIYKKGKLKSYSRFNDKGELIEQKL